MGFRLTAKLLLSVTKPNVGTPQGFVYTKNIHQLPLPTAYMILLTFASFCIVRIIVYMYKKHTTKTLSVSWLAVQLSLLLLTLYGTYKKHS